MPTREKGLATWCRTHTKGQVNVFVRDLQDGNYHHDRCEPGWNWDRQWPRGVSYHP